MAFYADEEAAWKCPKHPSKRRRTGICPVCLRDRLLSLCPDCANVRPCTCCPCSSSAASSSSSSSSSSFTSFSRFFSGCDVGAVGRVSSLIDSEPAFRRSRSLAIPFLRTRSRFVGGSESEFGSRKETPPASAGSTKSRYLSLWSVFKSNKCEDSTKKTESESGIDGEIDLRRTAVMMRSKSVAFVNETAAVRGGGAAKVGKIKGWHFPSPINVFRQPKISKIVVQQRSPMYRG